MKANVNEINPSPQFVAYALAKNSKEYLDRPTRSFFHNDFRLATAINAYEEDSSIPATIWKRSQVRY